MTDPLQLHEASETLYAALNENGAFLVTLDPNGRPNPMTIGWGLVGIAVREPLFSIHVSPGRYTNDCIRHAESFAVSVPRSSEFVDELTLCGTKSGREVDKVAAAGLTLAPGRSVSTPVVDGCALHFECEQLRIYEREGDVLAVFGRIAAFYASSSGCGSSSR